MNKPRQQFERLKKSIAWFACLAALPATIHSAIITSSFDDSAEGWTITVDGVLTHLASGGNPGGYLKFTDIGGANYAGFAPAKFLGDLRGFDGGSLSFDTLRISGCCNPDPDFGRVTLVSGAGSVILDLVPGGPGSTWTTYSAPFTAAAWGVSQSAWLDILSDVQAIRVALEAYGGSDDTGLDNFTLFVASVDSDGDGILDGDDACPNSDLSPTVVVGGVDSGVSNGLFETGCTLSDLVNHLVLECATGAKNHGKFVSCVTQGLNAMKKAALISGAEKGALTQAAAQSSLP